MRVPLARTPPIHSIPGLKPAKDALGLRAKGSSVVDPQAGMTLDPSITFGNSRAFKSEVVAHIMLGAE